MRSSIFPFIILCALGASACRTLVAVDDAIKVSANRTSTIPVLRNDGKKASIISFTQGEHGRVQGSDSLTLQYTPNPGFYGVDAFTYTAASMGRTATARVLVSIAQPTIDSVRVGFITGAAEDSGAITIEIRDSSFIYLRENIPAGDRRLKGANPTFILPLDQPIPMATSGGVTIAVDKTPADTSGEWYASLRVSGLSSDSTVMNLVSDGVPVQYGTRTSFHHEWKSQCSVRISTTIPKTPTIFRDSSFVIVAPVKTIAATSPQHEFTDIFARFKISDDFTFLATIDIPFNPDSVKSLRSFTRSLLVSDASFSFNMATDGIFSGFLNSVGMAGIINDYRQPFAGLDVRQFNNDLYAGFHFGSIETGGLLASSYITVGYLHRLYNLDYAYVHGVDSLLTSGAPDSIKAQQLPVLFDNNIYFGFALYAADQGLLSNLRIKGGIMIPMPDLLFIEPNVDRLHKPSSQDIQYRFAVEFPLNGLIRF